MNIANKTIDELPEKPGVYRLYQRRSNGDLKLLYVGQTKNLRMRIFNHEVSFDEFTYERIDKRELREQTEKYLITEFEPPLNTDLNPHPFSFLDETNISNSDPVEDSLKSFSELSNDIQDLLTAIARDPFQPVTQRYELFSSDGKAFNVKKTAIQQNLVREKWIRDKSKFKVLELTERGREFLQDLDVDTTHKGRGGIVHRYWQNRFCELFEETGYSAEIEKNCADVAVKARGKHIAIEVAMEATEREVNHVEDRLEGPFDAVLITCRNGAVQQQIAERLREQDMLNDKVELVLFQEVSEWKTGLAKSEV